MAEKRNRLVGSVRKELLLESREAALCAIKVFNDPLTKFKSATFIVLMVIAWTYLLHAYYRSKKIDYRYYDVRGKRKRYVRVGSGVIKHWELNNCLSQDSCPLDNETRKNLLFLIGLRDEIEHRMASSLDDYLSGRYQACAMNYNRYMKQLFGERYSLDPFIMYAIQLASITEEQLNQPKTPEKISPKVLAYIARFDDTLTGAERNSPHFSYSLLFTKRLVNRPGQADKVFEFIPPDSDLAKELQKQYIVLKPVEKPKYRAKDVVVAVQKAGFMGFRRQPEHVAMWKAEDAKNPAKGYGTDVAGTWYWYEQWVTRCIELCRVAGDTYKDVPQKGRSFRSLLDLPRS